MKRFSFAIVLAVLAFSVAPFVAAQIPQPERRVVYTLEPGEEILIPESSLCIAMDGVHITLVLTKGKEGPFFVVRDGVKKGPFAKLAEAMKVADEGRCDKPQSGSECAKYNPGDEAMDIASLVSEDERGQVIRFNGKTFGPYTMILSIKPAADKSLLYYVASEKDRTWFACTDGRKVQVGGMPGEFEISPDGRNALIKMMGTMSMAEMQKVGELPPDKLAEAMKDADKKVLYSIDGRKFGPFGENFSDFWFAVSSNAFYYEVADKVYRDGVLITVPEGFSACAYYPSEDGKRYVLHTYEFLIFSDGAKFPFPLNVFIATRNDRIIVKWAALENKKDLVVYQRAF
jgi:hypothetical protein